MQKFIFPGGFQVSRLSPQEDNTLSLKGKGKGLVLIIATQGVCVGLNGG